MGEPPYHLGSVAPMIALLARRFAGLVITLVIVSLLIFTVMDLLPGDPASILLGTSASPETLAAMRHDLGLDQPLILRYGQWLTGVLSGDLGQSYTYGVPVAGLIVERLAVTLPAGVDGDRIFGGDRPAGRGTGRLAPRPCL